MKKGLCLALVACVGLLHASELKIAAGAGYKKPVLKIVKEYEKTHGKVDAFFGNMKQVSAQAKNSDIALIIGDKNYLQNRSKINFEKYTTVGVGKAVLAYSKNTTIKKLEDIKSNKISRVAMPQPKKAIYGIAGQEILNNAKLYKNIKEKLFVVATVPQVATYLVANEVDAGIINLTAALANKDRIGGYINIDQNLYSKIEIVAGSNKYCHTDECKKFLEFLNSKKAKDIFTKYGL